MNLWPIRPLRSSAVLLFSVLCLLAFAPARAQDEGGLVSSTADYVYGQTMRFHLSAANIGTVQAITFYFRLGASADSFAVDIDVPAGPRIDVSYALDLTQTRLPPFITVTYWWELERPEDTLSVPEQIISYTDDQFNWSQLVETDEVGGGSVRVHWTGEGTAIGEQARDLVFEMLPHLAPLLPVERVLPFDVYIYPSTADLGAAMRLAGRDFQPGQTYPELGVVLATVVNPETAEAELRPDLARGLVDLLLFQGLGQSAYRIPPWLTYGLAGAVRGAADIPGDDALRAAISSESTLPVDELCAGLPIGGTLAAAQSEALVRFIAANYGDAAVRDLVAAFAAGDDCPAAFQRVLQLTPAQLEAAWLRSLHSSAGRSTAELAVWIGLAVAGFALAGLLLLRPRRPGA
ncbi:MAG TPA: hypothetical protein PLH39_05465 [Promineifilum sp.]|nr:hypothetical protein [Promineifilum sp.]